MRLLFVLTWYIVTLLISIPFCENIFKATILLLGIIMVTVVVCSLFIILSEDEDFITKLLKNE